MSFDTESAEVLAQRGCLVGTPMERHEDPDVMSGGGVDA